MRKNKALFFLPLILGVFGLIMVFNASSASALVDFQNKFHYFGKQAISLSIGIAAFLFFSYFDYKRLKKIALPLFLVNLVILILVLIPGLGKEVYGGKRWLQFGFFGFQPAELTKLSLVIYLSTLLEKKRSLLPFLTIMGLLLFLVMLEPDLGTAGIISATAVCLYFVSGASLKQMAGIIVAGSAIFPVLIFSSGYRKTRFLSFLNSPTNLSDTTYHVKQILISLGAGGFWGRGFGQSRQKFLFLPEVATDSIFAVIAEEFGFVGASVLIFAIIFLIVLGFRVALQTNDFFGKMLASGIIFFIALQAVINLASMVSLIPLTGVPLPFISFGGSSLLVSLSGMGIVYNISRNCGDM